MNKVMNEFGVIRRDNGVGQMVDAACKEAEEKLGRIIAAYDLNPVELRCLCDYVSSSVACFFAETNLRKGIAMRKERREAQKCGCGE